MKKFGLISSSPDEILETIFCFLNPQNIREFQNLSLVCKSWNRVSNQNRFWIFAFLQQKNLLYRERTDVSFGLYYKDFKTSALKKAIDSSPFKDVIQSEKNKFDFFENDQKKQPPQEEESEESKEEFDEENNQNNSSNNNNNNNNKKGKLTKRNNKKSKKNQNKLNSLFSSSRFLSLASTFEEGILKKATFEISRIRIRVEKEYTSAVRIEQQILDLDRQTERFFWESTWAMGLIPMFLGALFFVSGWTRCSRLEEKIQSQLPTLSLCFHRNDTSSFLLFSSFLFFSAPFFMRFKLLKLIQEKRRKMGQAFTFSNLINEMLFSGFSFALSLFLSFGLVQFLKNNTFTVREEAINDGVLVGKWYAFRNFVEGLIFNRRQAVVLSWNCLFPYLLTGSFLFFPAWSTLNQLANSN